MIYRFHPSVKWDRGYPKRDEIIEQVEELWHRYGLDKKTKFGVEVTHIYNSTDGRWVINDTSNGVFEGIIAAVGTCGEPRMPHMPGVEKFSGEIYHSSQLRG